MRRLAILSLLMLAVILIPFFVWGERIEQCANEYVRSGAGWWQVSAVIAGLLAADIVLPVPSSVLSTAAGVLLGFSGGALTSWMGMMVGCLIGYLLGGRAPGEKMLGPVEMQRVYNAQQRYGDWMLILFRAVPVLAEATVFFAGLTSMPLRRFILITATSNLGISLAYAGTGAFLGGRESFLMAFAGAIAIPALAMLGARLVERRAAHANILRTTTPPTSVNRKSRPM